MKVGMIAALCAALCGCAGYRWSSSVPEDMRTVAVPVFENRTKAAELGPIVTQYTLREFQREGTYAIRRTGDSAIEVQGAIVEAHRKAASYDRSGETRGREYRYYVTAEVSFVDKKNSKVLIENRKYQGETTFLGHDDMLTGQRNAAQRIAADIARQVVDDATALFSKDR